MYFRSNNVHANHTHTTAPSSSSPRGRHNACSNFIVLVTIFIVRAGRLNTRISKHAAFAPAKDEDDDSTRAARRPARPKLPCEDAVLTSKEAVLLLPVCCCGGCCLGTAAAAIIIVEVSTAKGSSMTIWRRLWRRRQLGGSNTCVSAAPQQPEERDEPNQEFRKATASNNKPQSFFVPLKWRKGKRAL